MCKLEISRPSSLSEMISQRESQPRAGAGRAVCQPRGRIVINPGPYLGSAGGGQVQGSAFPLELKDSILIRFNLLLL